MNIPAPRDILEYVVYAVLFACAAYSGFQWYVTDEKLTDLSVKYDAAQQRLGVLEAKVSEQNAAIAALEQQRQEAVQRADAAWATANGITAKVDGLSKALSGKKANTCTEAMPYVRATLEGLRK